MERMKKVFDDLMTGLDEVDSFLAGRTSEHDGWFRSKMQEALDDPRPGIPHEQAEEQFAKRRTVAMLREQK